jgi:prephenate dehydrogenase/chorismate mutase
VSKQQDKFSAKESLARTREEIRAITKSILDQANARQKASLRISGDKELLGEAIANPEVEKKVLSDSIEYAKSIGLDVDFARTIVLELIRNSKMAQSEDIYKKQIVKFLDSKNIEKIAIVGAGRMGMWFARYFSSLSRRVFLYDEEAKKARERSETTGVEFYDNLEDVAHSDLVIISAPISKTPRIVRELATLKRTDVSDKRLIVAEISSIKNGMGISGLLDDAASQNGSIALFSIHPLFGGSAKPFDSNSMVQTFPRDTTLMRGLFPHYTIVSIDWKDHDQLMGLFLTLPHALALVFADSINPQRKLWEEAAAVSSPSYSQMLELAKRVLSEDPDIYYEIQASNPNSEETLSETMNSLLRLEKLLKNRVEFVSFFAGARRKIEQLDDLRKAKQS